MASKRSREYLELKEFFSFFADRYFGAQNLPPEQRPSAVLERLETEHPKKAASGLHMGINDCVEMSFELDPKEVAKTDELLHGLGILTLSEVRRRFSKKYAAIVKRGRIRSDAEFYLIRNVLGDPTIESPGEREALEKMVDDYEGV